MKLKFVLISSICVLFTVNGVTHCVAASTQATNKQLSQQKEKVKSLEVEITKLRETVNALRSLAYGPRDPTPAAETQAMVRYTIKEGETVTQIANRHGISRESLMKVNQIAENQQIYIGDELLIPAPPTPPTPEKVLVEAMVDKPSPRPRPSPKPSPEKIPKQTKPTSTKQAVTIAWTKRAPAKTQQKKVETPKAKPVTVAKVEPKPEVTKPSPPKKETPQPKIELVKTEPKPRDPGFTYYTIQFGDSLGKIAKKHGISLGALIHFNNIKNPDKISGGQKLKIPSKETAKSLTKVKPSPAPALASSSDDKPLPGDSYGIYTVQTGDTLYGLARDFFTTEKEIQSLNNLGDKHNIVPGQDLIVPTGEYFKKGDLANN